jgi:hypothetical protein
MWINPKALSAVSAFFVPEAAKLRGLHGEALGIYGIISAQKL